MREVEVAGRMIDAGPTVFTMRWIFEEIFAAAGQSLADHVSLKPLEVLARHAWSADQRLDLFASAERSADAIGAFAGAAEARAYGRFRDQARRTYETLDAPFMRAQRPTPEGLAASIAMRNFMGLWQINPFDTLWGALGGYFRDPRLRQLFGRYATYCGSSPFLAPATLMLVAHVEQSGVWLIEGGMHRLAQALTRVGELCGARFRFDSEVAEVVVAQGKAAGVKLASGERIEADAVVMNADVSAVAGGLFGRPASGAADPVPRRSRSLSAVTWAMVAAADGFPLLHHSVFFSGDYGAEFDDIFERGGLPRSPTIYVCAQDRDDHGARMSGEPERLFCLVNAPATGDTAGLANSELERCEETTFRFLESRGLTIERDPTATIRTAPGDFERLFPGTGGALYGEASHGWNASFTRPGSRSRIPGLYFAGGSAHPGPGIPMAALSGRLAAQSLLEDLASTRRFHRAAMPGGTSTR